MIRRLLAIASLALVLAACSDEDKKDEAKTGAPSQPAATAADAQKYGIFDQVLSQLATRALLDAAAKDMNVGVSDEAVQRLQERTWYGNVRELRNAMEHAVIVARGGAIEVEHLPQSAAASLIDATSVDLPLDEAIAELIERWSEAKLADALETDELHEQLLQLVEPTLLKAAIAKHRGQCASAARQLGLHRTTLRKKLDEYGIADD